MAFGPRGCWQLLSAAAMLLLAINAGEASAARVKCAGTFRVLHNDHVGRMSLPAGRYQITILSSGTPSCAAASKLFTRFLEDFDGKLPNGYRISAAKRAFVKSPGVGFAVKRNGGGGGGGGGGGRHPKNGRFCAGHLQRPSQRPHRQAAAAEGPLLDHPAAEERPDLRPRLGAVQQVPRLPRRTPAKPLAGQPGDREVPARAARQRLPRQADQLEPGPAESRAPSRLSGGRGC